jgi:hypothetical protein
MRLEQALNTIAKVTPEQFQAFLRTEKYTRIQLTS